MLVAAESFRLRRAASRSRRISAASGSCGLSRPVFSKFSKVILGSHQKKLGLAGDAREESVTGLELGAHIPFGHHDGVDLAPQPGLGCRQCLHHIGESRGADHEHIHVAGDAAFADVVKTLTDRKSTRLNSSHVAISYAVFCLKKKNKSLHHNYI